MRTVVLNNSVSSVRRDVDALVQRAQQWVNATYKANPQYKVCVEDGITGWATMYSLTRALQIELGISPASDAFGPTTLSKLEARGPVRPGEPNANLVKIIQSGCYCKGYDPGGLTGTYGSGTSSAVVRLMGDMGLASSTDNSLPPKVFKGLLAMDAYTVVSGGTTEIQSIQRWLNNRYWKKSTFFVSPCDGLYTRDVQKAHMKALQYEFGIPEASVNGNFGTATQDGLRAHPVQVGSTGIFVQLFSAACVFNGRVIVYPGATPVSTVFKATFDAPLQEYVQAFQRFSALPLNGRGDYDTWAQLLVSMGNADRPVTACDTRFQITPTRATTLKNRGYEIVGRYLDEPSTSTLNKELQPGELADIMASGLRMFPISQYNGRLITDFTRAIGYDHGLKATERALGYKLARGTVIYFAVDYDATDEQIQSNILPYFYGVQNALADSGRVYVAGVYGSRNVCNQVSNKTNARHSFLSGMSYGFSGNLGYPSPGNWSFNQIKEEQVTDASGTYDLDRVVSRGTDPGVGPGQVGQSASTTSDFLKYIDDLYACAVLYNKGNPSQRVMEFLRYDRYTTYAGWTTLFGPIDAEWITYAQRNGPVRKPTFVDPSYGVKVNVDHLAATANGVFLKGSGVGAEANRGDFAGWGGDLATLYGQWQAQESSYASGSAYCAAKLAQVNVTSSFSFTDLIEDVDGYLIGTAVKNGANIHEEFRRHLGTGGGHLTRFKRFWTGRYGGDKTVCMGAARTMLRDVGIDDVLDNARDGVIYVNEGVTIVPFYLPAYKLDPFLEGYANRIQALSMNG